MGVHHDDRVELASAHLVVAHARRVDRRHAPVDLPPHEHPPARGDHVASVPGVQSDDGPGGPQRARCGAVRRSPIAHRVGRLDRRTEGRAERPVLDADASRLGTLHRPALPRPVPRRARLLRPGLDGEADARLPSHHPVPARSLAARAARGQVGSEKGPARLIRSRGPFRRDRSERRLRGLVACPRRAGRTRS